MTGPEREQLVRRLVAERYGGAERRARVRASGLAPLCPSCGDDLLPIRGRLLADVGLVDVLWACSCAVRPAP